jgi:hypothetical protein
MLDYGKALLFYSQKAFNELGGLIAQKAMNKGLKAKAAESEPSGIFRHHFSHIFAVEAPLMSKAKGKVINETVSDSEEEEDLDGADVQASFTEAWENLESARYIVELVSHLIHFSENFSMYKSSFFCR